MGDLNVCFQIDTDNRENFPSITAFQTFKDQRDRFYEIFRIWEKDHSVDGWTFQIALGSKVRTMLTLHNDATNYYHFARLFKSQLLISCIQNRQQAQIEDDESISILKTLKNVNPQKLNQLQKRLVTPQPSKNQITEPSFPGVQEFFKDFILFAFNPIFYVHLENCLIHEIMELNDTQFNNSEIEDSETTVDEQTQENFITCLSSLRLLAKVLGLLVSLPYRSESNNFKELIATQVEVRSKVVPAINLHLCLHNAIALGKLSLTVPWIAKYLAMMDTVSLRLPYYKQTLELLYYIHKYSTSDSFISHQAVILLKSTLNWLFELPNIPKDFYPTWQKTFKVKELRNLKQLNKQYVQKYMLVGEPTVSVTSTKSNLDKLDIINERTLHICCPLVGINVSVSNTNTNLNNYNSNKHITPVSSQLNKSAKSAGIKHLELQLEEAFFHGQPASTRKTVDFVSERVASTCVKHICNTLLMTSRETNLNNFREILKMKQNERQPEKFGEQLINAKDFKALVVTDMNTLATNVSKELKGQYEATIPGICESRVTKSIESLLAEDSLAPVKEMCCKIAIRLAMERIYQWIQSHIVGGSLFIKDMELELNRFLKNSTPLEPMQEKKHNPNAISPTTITDNMREFILLILDNGGDSLTITVITTILDTLYQTLNERADLVVGTEKVLYSLSTDFALFLVAYRSDLFIPKVQEKFITIWSMSRCKALESDSPIRRIFSSRNVMLLAQSEKEEVWTVFGKFIKKLIEKNVLDINCFSDQCVALFRQNWPVPMLMRLSTCLMEVMTDFKESDRTTGKVRYLLGWIAEAYKECESSEEMETLYTGAIHGFPQSNGGLTNGISTGIASSFDQDGVLSLIVVLGGSLSLVALVFAFITYR
ncbi:Codanin-1 [Eufriesea mexicana]|uniref:Codanin-1 n=1 Tax=Eufriesea mexicana TaxID=516756 RepID=A0A310SSD7_9HYME|nr:Codanin-1 [Eufriesea mexicana]